MSDRLRNQSRINGAKIFWPPQPAVKIFPLSVTRYLLKFYFRGVSDDIVDLRLRRSVNRWSDVNITLIIKDETSRASESAILAAMERVRRRSILIGEFEVYKTSEFTEKARIEANVESLTSVAERPPLKMRARFDGSLIATLKAEDLWLQILSNQYERLRTKGRARLVDEAEGALLIKKCGELAKDILFLKTDLNRRLAFASFNVYGLRLEITSTDDDRGRAILADIQSEWSFFSAEPSAEAPELSMTLRLREQVRAPKKWPVRTHLGSLAILNRRRWVRYDDQSVVALRETEGGRAIEVGLCTLAAKSSLENLLHSSLGEHLEAKGFIRLHAAAYLDAGKPSDDPYCSGRKRKIYSHGGPSQANIARPLR